jgi:hypothetical protein
VEEVAGPVSSSGANERRVRGPGLQRASDDVGPVPLPGENVTQRTVRRMFHPGELNSFSDPRELLKPAPGFAIVFPLWNKRIIWMNY